MCIGSLPRVSRKHLEQFKSEIKLSKQQREVLVGLILGDGHLESQDNEASYRLVYSQGGKNHQEYLYHVYEIFKSCRLSTPSVRAEQTRIRQRQWRFRTVSFGALRFYGKLFYKQKRKVIPKQLFRFLTARSLAYWYMDDGSIKSKQSKGVLLNT